MAFSDLKQLEEHLSSRSYITGYEPTQDDVGVYNSLKTPPSASEYPHVARWYDHIKSWEAQHPALPGDKDAGAKLFGGASSSTGTAQAAASQSAPAAEDDDEIDLFGSDDDDPEAERIKAERVAAYEQKKSAKPKTIAKSVVTLDVKPWDDETDMSKLEEAVRSIQKDGLVWGSSKLVAVGFGIKKLQMTLVIEDDKISLDELQEEIQDFEDYVQSTDVAAMQKL